MALEIFAPAKINLTLDVLGKRSDGYHELETIMQTVSLGDTLQLSDAAVTEIITDHPALSTGPDNLAYRAVTLVCDHIGKQRGVRIRLYKRIPIAAGLAGGSTDAAAVLRGLNMLWELDLSEEVLHNLAARLGSDVAFCLRGGTALGKGRGEQLTVLPPIPSCGVVLVKPPFAVSTKEVYQHFRLDKGGCPATEMMLNAVQKGDRRAIMSALHNMLETVTMSMYPEIGEIKAQLRRAGAQAVLMSGSGPTVFGLTDTLIEAQQVAGRMDMCQNNLFVAETTNGIYGGEKPA